MGTPVSPIVANLCMEDYEGKALEAYLDPIKYWGRYIDDALAVIKTANIEPVTHHLNAQHTSIQWISELEADVKLPMLDTLTTRDGSLKFSVYRKLTHTHAVPKSPTHGTQGGCHQNTDTPGGYHHIKPPRQRTRNETLEEGTKRCGILQVSLAGSWSKKIKPHLRNTDSDRAKGHVTPPLCRRSDRTNLPPNKKDGCRRPFQASYRHQEYPSGHDCEDSYIGKTERALK